MLNLLLKFSRKLLKEHSSKYEALGEEESMRIMQEILAMKIGLNTDQVNFYSKGKTDVLSFSQSNSVAISYSQNHYKNIYIYFSGLELPVEFLNLHFICLLYTSPSPRDATLSRMPSSA